MSFIVNPYVYSSPLCADADGNAFLIATGITDATISGAICTLVTSLKSAGLWTKMDAIYPFVGGTATTHMYNLKNPANTNAAFRLTFTGGWTHSANGIQPNGTNAYAETYYLHTLLNSSHMSIYSRTNSVGLYNDIGNATNIAPNSIIIPNFTNRFYGHINQNIDLSVANTDTRGLFLASRTGANTLNLFRNSTNLINATTVSTSIPTQTMVISAWKQAPSTISRYSNRQLAFATMGQGITIAEEATLYSIIQTFQTTLGRQV